MKWRPLRVVLPYQTDTLMFLSHFQIAALSAGIAKVKAEDSKLTSTLENLRLQQTEFEQALQPLEASLPVTVKTEPEREKM